MSFTELKSNYLSVFNTVFKTIKVIHVHYRKFEKTNITIK